MKLILLDYKYKIIEENIIDKPKSFEELCGLLEKKLKKILNKNHYKIYFYRESEKDYIEINNNNIYQEVEDILFLLSIEPKDLNKSEFSLNLNKLNEKEKEEVEEKYQCILCQMNIKDNKPYFCYLCQKKFCEKCLKDWDKKRKDQNQECNCPYCKKELPLDQWNKINSYLENRKNEAERMKALNQYELNKNLNYIQLEEIKHENIKLKKEIIKYRNLINTMNLNNNSIKIINLDKEQDNKNEFCLINDEEKDNNDNNNDINKIEINNKISDIYKKNNINEYNSDIVTNFGDIKDGYKNEYNNNKITIFGDKRIENEYKNEINLIYFDENGGDYKNILGERFINNNKYNIKLFINGNEIFPLDYKYKLNKGNNKIKIFITNKITNLENMFYECSTLLNIEELKYLYTGNVTNFSYIFYGCKLLSDISPLEYWDVSNGENFGSMFKGCESLTNIKPLENWNISKSTNCGGMFNGCISLTNIKSLENWNVSNCTNFGSMFKDCKSLTNIISLENWNVSKGTNFGSAFNGCQSLINIKSLENWNVSEGTNFGSMFNGCELLTNINSLQNWNVSKSENFGSMFNGCKSLTNIKYIQDWDVSKCGNFACMFKGCSSLNDIRCLENWSLSDYGNYKNMFNQCNKIPKNQLQYWKGYI